MLTGLITSTEPALRDRSLDDACRGLDLASLLEECAELEAFRRRSENLYQRVRALFFLYAIHRFHLPARLGPGAGADVRRGLVPFRGFQQLLARRFEEGIDAFLSVQAAEGPSDGISSALAAAYQRLAFQTLADQVRRSVRSVRGNQWMFRVGHPADHPLRLRTELLRKDADGTYPVLRERTPVRMDLTHCGWSDIFFLGMDHPEGARVLNASVDLGIHGRDAAPRPPVEAYLRVVEEPVLRLASVDLGATADVTSLAEVFDFARDYLGLLKAAVIAAGIVPPGVEGAGQSLADLLARVVGPGLGLEIVSSVNGVPKGSRLAVSTTLLAALVSACMRATGQAHALTGSLLEEERRLVLARALLGEWLGGSGGGWQDSGGVWPGVKLISGVLAAEGDPEYGVSRGRLLPSHQILGPEDASPRTRAALQESLVLVHGGLAQNVGPILEMVTEKYLLRSEAEWAARKEMLGILEEIRAALRGSDLRGLGDATTRNFAGPLLAIIPWATNAYTELLIERARQAFGPDYWGFWMLGGMSGGGMGFLFAPSRKAEAQSRMQQIMSQTKQELRHALPFAMEPVVYDFALNERGTCADLLAGPEGLMPPGYYALTVPSLVRKDRHVLPAPRRAEMDKFGAACRNRPELGGMVQALFDALLPRTRAETGGQALLELLEQHGFDRAQHEQIRADLRDGRIGLAQNRLPVTAAIEDVRAEDVATLGGPGDREMREAGLSALRRGEVAVVTLAAGSGSRWTQGAGVVKALHPFCRLSGRHRTFLETHLAKSRRVSREAGTPIPHVVTTSYLTHGPIAELLERLDRYGYEGPLLLSPGRAVGLRLVPTERDLRFLWEETAQQVLDEQQQKVRESLRAALIGWTRATGEATDYTDNLPLQCLHPVGHWYELPNLLRNGVLARLLAERPQLRVLMLHNVDAVGADVDPAVLGHHLASGACLTFEVIRKRIEDHGGGLARVNGRPRLVEGLAMPREEDEFRLAYYNAATCWIDLDRLLHVFGLSRHDVAAGDSPRVQAAVRALAARMPTYVTLKEVKKRWGHGQEDVFPVTQFEKLWGDMTMLPEVEARYLVVPRQRGQQLKDQAQLDGWLRDGSAEWVDRRCAWT
ncbi:MAG TPA: UTP--glucose-1-phosphate uridylyltransferase [Anaeromyxobacter sp.]|nr:UTP--glucose-1-phosphate uridylyltransferase [Anaeromyxobacter sp.]